MWTIFRKFAWLAGVSLIPGLLPRVRATDARPAVHGATDFHHTEWNGLGAVFDIKQSSEGYLWLTTSKGVLRFDGARFQSVEEVTRGAARNSEIDSVFLSSSGGLWPITEGAGLLLWKDGLLTNFPDRRCTPKRRQGQLIEDRDGSLWVQGATGLFHLRGSVCEQIGAEQGYTGGFPIGALMGSDGTLWVKTRNGRRLGPAPFCFCRRASRSSRSANTAKERRPAMPGCMKGRTARFGFRTIRGSAVGSAGSPARGALPLSRRPETGTRTMLSSATLLLPPMVLCGR